MAPPLLHLRDIALTFGGAPLLEAAELKVDPGGRVALVGRNGSGKSTLLKIAAGLVLPDKGTRFLQPGARVRYLPQEPDLSAYATVLAYVEAGLDEGDDTHQARRILGELGLDPDVPPQRLSGGEVRRAGLARTLAPSPDVLLLDEPTNHLDLPAIEWLEGELKASPAALVLISHDRRFLTAMSRQCVWLDRGATRTLDRGFDAFEEWRDQLMEEEERERHKLDRQIVREQDWLRYGVTARRKRNVRRLAQLHDLRARAKNWRGPQGDAKVAAAEGGTSGTLVIEAKDISISFGGREIVSRFSTRIHRGDRVGVIGANGAGKTTLLKMLTGNLAPDSGQVRLGSAVEMVTLDQMRSSLDAGETLSGTLTGGRGDQVIVGGQSRHVMSYMKDFLFTPDQARQPVGALSGGERGRLALAVALARPSNLLVLDEPTNDLDLETLDLLQELIGDYAGTVLVVSHDRDFLDRVASFVIAHEGGALWREYPGGYSDMVRQRAAKGLAGVMPVQPAKPGERPKQVREAAAAPARKLSFKDKHALETLPGEIAGLQKKIAALQAMLADSGLYARDAAAFARATADLEKASRALDESETRWLELEMLRDALERG